MKRLQKLSAQLLLVLFCCYYSSISFFSHTHIVNGISIVHSHFSSESDHNHSEAQYAVIDILSHFQSESATDYCHCASPFYILSEISTQYQIPSHTSDATDTILLRGPPTSMTEKS